MTYVCRLCSSTNNVINLFDPDLKCGDGMRYCILLASGIHIKKEDRISTKICYCCCEIAVKLFKYRINAITNDKALKIKCGQPYNNPPIFNPQVLQKVASSLGTHDYYFSDPLDLLCVRINNCGFILKKISSSVSNVKKQSGCKLNINKNNDLKKSAITQVQTSNTCLPTKRIIKKHPSVIKLLSEHKNIILPENVLHDDISPSVSLDLRDFEEWYDKQSQDQLEVTLEDIPVTFNVSDNSSVCEIESDSSITDRLRKRTFRRIIVDWESEDEEFIGNKVPKRTDTVTSSSENIAIPSKPVNVKKNNDNVRVSSTTTDADLEKTVSISSLSRVNSLQRNATGLFTDFNKYGYHTESTDLTIELSDDEDYSACAYNQESLFRKRDLTSQINSKIKSLFAKHYKFNPNTASIHYKSKGMIVLQNMLYELKKYSIPLEIKYSSTYEIQFLTETPCRPDNLTGTVFWSQKDCTGIKTPTSQLGKSIIANVDGKKPETNHIVYGPPVPVTLATPATHKRVHERITTVTASTYKKKTSNAHSTKSASPNIKSLSSAIPKYVLVSKSSLSSNSTVQTTNTLTTVKCYSGKKLKSVQTPRTPVTARLVKILSKPYVTPITTTPSTSIPVIPVQPVPEEIPSESLLLHQLVSNEIPTPVLQPQNEPSAPRRVGVIRVKSLSELINK